MEKLTENEQSWLNDFNDYINSNNTNKNNYDYVISWWLARNLKIKTSTVNYRLKKLVLKGVLTSKSFSYGVEYKLAK